MLVDVLAPGPLEDPRVGIVEVVNFIVSAVMKFDSSTEHPA